MTGIEFRGQRQKSKSGDPMTPRQAEVFAFIVAYTRQHGIAPTFREMTEGMGFSGPSAAWCHIRPLRAKGYISASGKGKRIVITAGRVCECCGGLGRILDTEAEAGA